MASEFDIDDYVKKPEQASKPELIAVYSPPGQGKSWLAATASEIPGFKKILILDTEGSTVGTLNGFDPDKIDVIRLDQHPKPLALFTKVLESQFENPTYDAIVIDTFDVAQDWAIKYAKQKFGDTGDAVFKAWDWVKEWSLDVAREGKATKPLVIILVHEREEKEKSGAITSKMRLSGSAKDLLPGIPDTVIYLSRGVDPETDLEVTTAYFATEDKMVTKNRFGFPVAVKNVTLPKLWKHIDNNSKTKESN